MDDTPRLETVDGVPTTANSNGSLRQYLNPLLVTLKCVGLYFDADHYPEVRRYLSDTTSNQNTYTCCRRGSNKEITELKENVSDIETNPTRSGITTSCNNDSFVGNDSVHGTDNSLNQQILTNNFIPILLSKSSGIIDEQEFLSLIMHGKSQKDEFAEVKKPQRRSLVSKFACFRFVFRGRIYAIIVMMMIWYNLLRLVTVIGDDSISLILLASAISWYGMSAITVTIMFVNCWKKSCFSTFFINSALLNKDATSRQMGLRGIVTNRSMKCMIGFLGVLILSNTGFYLYFILQNNEMVNKIMHSDGLNSSIPSLVVSFVLSFYQSCSTFSCLYFIMIVCKALVAYFKQFKETLKKQISDAGDKFPTKFSQLREHYLVMCNLTAIFDKYTGAALGTIFGCTIVNVCLATLQLITEESDPQTFGVVFIVIAATLLSIVLLVLNASDVHNVMHSILTDMQTLKTKDVTPEQEAQLQLFLSKVNDPDQGLSVLGLFMLKKRFLMTLLGLYITYIVVLIQFHQTSTTMSSDVVRTEAVGAD